MLLKMFWAQAVGSLLVWLGTAFAFRKAIEPLKHRFKSTSRSQLTILGALAMLLGAAILFGGLFVASSGLHPTHMDGWAWGLITVLGAGFVALQGVGAAIIAQLVFGRVTEQPHSTSIIQEDS